MVTLTRRQAFGALGGTALILAAPAFAGVTLADSAGGSDGSWDAAGYLYVNDNTKGANTVAGFARLADGRLVALPTSPCSIGGAGTGTGIGSQGAVQITRHGRLLLVTDAGSNTISVLRIHADGTLHPVDDSPFSSGGTQPVSIAVHDELVYVANAGGSVASGIAGNYTGFTLTAAGGLHPLSDSTVTIPAGSAPGDIFFSPNGRRLVATRIATSLIDSFVVDDDGRLTKAPGSPFTAQGFGPFGSAFRPTNSEQLYVSNAHNAQGGAGAGTVSAYQVAGNGNLTALTGSPYADQQIAPCWLAITRDGRYLFVVNTASDSISRYRVNGDGTLSLLGSTILTGGSGQGSLGAVELGFDRSGRTLYCLESKHRAVAALSVSGGSLSELSSSPFSLPNGATPFGLAVI